MSTEDTQRNELDGQEQAVAASSPAPVLEPAPSGGSAGQLHILIVEDSLSDAGLVARHVERAGYEVRWERVDSAGTLQAALQNQRWDVVLCDFSMPGFNGMQALAIVRKSSRDLPLIFVSGEMGEDVAVEAMRAGAHDYVLKGNLKRLVPAIERELREAEIHRQRQHAEAALRESDAQFRVMFELASVGMGQADPRTGQLRRVNQKLCAITGYSADELLQMRFSDITHPDDRARDWELFQCVIRGECPDYHVEKRYIRKDGTLAWVSVNVTVLRNVSGQPLRTMATIEDITHRKRAEEERTRLATAMEQAAEAIVMTDDQGAILYVNPAFETITGYQRAEVLGQNPRILKSGKHDAAFYQQLWNTLLSGEVWRGRLTNRRKDGALYEEAATISPVRDAAGKVVNYVAIKLDVTREGALETQLRQSQKMEMIGRLAGGVAHDFNNLLVAILGYSDITLKALSADDPLRKHIEEIRFAGDRAAALTRQLLAFSRKQTLQPQMLDLNELIANLNMMLGRLIGEDIQLTTRFDEALGRVKADPNQIEQVITNLAVNARDAMPHGGKLTIQTTNVAMDEPFAGQPSEVVPGPYAAMIISDTGTGMTEEVKAHLFEPFFTTKGPGKGTGLGLATVYGIVNQSGGHIAVCSEVGHGTTFTVYLPWAQETGPVAPPTETSHALPHGNETILVVEDEALVRNLVLMVLEDCGYTVLAASNGPGALELAGQHQGRIHLLLTDMVMPEIGGGVLARLLVGQNPGIKVIYMSGYTDSQILPEDVLAEESHFLQKPFTMDGLAHKVREALDAKPTDSRRC